MSVDFDRLCTDPEYLLQVSEQQRQTTMAVFDANGIDYTYNEDTAEISTRVFHAARITTDEEFLDLCSVRNLSVVYLKNCKNLRSMALHVQPKSLEVIIDNCNLACVKALISQRLSVRKLIVDGVDYTGNCEVDANIHAEKVQQQQHAVYESWCLTHYGDTRSTWPPFETYKQLRHSKNAQVWTQNIKANPR